MRKIVLIFNAREYQFEIGSRRTFREMADSYSEFANLMREGHATLILNRSVYTSDSTIPSEAEIEAAVANRRISDPNFLYDTQNLKFMITPAKVKQG